MLFGRFCYGCHVCVSCSDAQCVEADRHWGGSQSHAVESECAHKLCQCNLVDRRFILPRLRVDPHFHLRISGPEAYPGCKKDHTIVAPYIAETEEVAPAFESPYVRSSRIAKEHLLASAVAQGNPGKPRACTCWRVDQEPDPKGSSRFAEPVVNKQMFPPLRGKGAKGAPNCIGCGVAAIGCELVPFGRKIAEVERPGRNQIGAGPGISPSQTTLAAAYDRAVVLEIFRNDQLGF